MTILLITLLIRKLRKWHQKKQLQWQQTLASKGIGFRTKIMQVLEDAKLFNGYKRIHVVAVIRVHGKIVCYRMHSWIKPGEMPPVGERVVIKYQPGVHNVLIKHVSV